MSQEHLLMQPCRLSHQPLPAQCAGSMFLSGASCLLLHMRMTVPVFLDMRHPGRQVSMWFSGVSVMDKDRLWYKAVSFGDVPHGFQQPRRMGFCHWALLAPNPEVTVVPDMTKDLRQAPRRTPKCTLHTRA